MKQKGRQQELQVLRRPFVRVFSSLGEIVRLACDSRYCSYDAVHKDYVYTPAWADFLVEKLGDSATYDLIVRGIAPAPNAQT